MILSRSKSCLVLWLLASTPATAAWLRCTAAGVDARGSFADVTAIADVGDVGPQQLAQFQQRLVTYVGKINPGASGTHAECSVSNDRIEAATKYTRSWNAATSRLGWNRVSLVLPTAWLSETEIKNDAEGF